MGLSRSTSTEPLSAQVAVGVGMAWQESATKPAQLNAPYHSSLIGSLAMPPTQVINIVYCLEPQIFKTILLIHM